MSRGLFTLRYRSEGTKYRKLFRLKKCVQTDGFPSINLSAGMPMDRRFAQRLKLLKDIMQGTVRSMNSHCGKRRTATKKAILSVGKQVAIEGYSEDSITATGLSKPVAVTKQKENRV